MKKRILVLAAFAVIFGAHAQNTFPSSGNVGIGTNNPNEKLHIHSSSRSFLKISGLAPGVLFSPTASQSLYVAALGLATGNNHYVSGSINGDFAMRSSVGGRLLFGSFTPQSQNATIRMTIANNGKIGIGTTSPTANLHINSAADAGPGQNPVLLIGQRAGNHIDIDGNEILALNNNSFSNLFINGSGSTANTIINGNGGKVGIHTASPLANLHINSAADAGPGQNPVLLIGQRTGNHIDIDGNEILALNNNSFSNLYINGSGSTANTIINGNGGNVGIGTDDTRGYKLAVHGNILAEELKIRTYNNWPDYVFDKSYQLKPLEELEKEIQKNGHLPNIPSAKEVKENGFNVGKMNAKLLEKVEELTLYIIQQQKEIEILKKAVLKPAKN